ncbi:hypothetical protein Xen7305DRAFT_00040400 [Xenococcus sp. PCC 7305]|nr:hypothetical protein Xen7305DRAFT_00040400 [Xenococcus sp. PCC 7305]
MDALLEDIPALEISTTIVREIIPEVFIPEEVYRAIYQISPSYLQSMAIDAGFCDHYFDLRRRLELQYALLVVNTESKLYNPRLKSAVQLDLPTLARSTTNWSDIPTRLPSPDSSSDRDRQILNKLLQETPFVITLRQLGKQKSFLDSRALTTQQIATADTPENQIPNDITYAKTSIKIDGKINNCYAQEILKLDAQAQQTIIELHNKGILAGEKQWHQFLGFILKTFNI